MIVAAMIVGIGGAVLSAGGAFVAGKPLLAVAGYYMAGGTAGMLLSLIAGTLRPAPPQATQTAALPVAQPDPGLSRA